MGTADDKFYRVKIIKRADFSPDLWMIRIQASGEFKKTAARYFPYDITPKK